MLITKFNKLIRNKFIWGAFAVLVVIAFLGFMTPGSRSGGSKEQPSIGILFGEPIVHKEFVRARIFALGFQKHAGASKEEREALHKQAWRRIAALRAADAMGITVSDREVGMTIHNDQSFQVNGAFSQARYQSIIQLQLGVNISTFEDYLREEMIIRKLGSLLGSTLWISPTEVQDSTSRLTDLFTIQVAEAKKDEFIDPEKVTLDDARSFYETNSLIFEIPDQILVRHVSWPVSNYLTEVEVSEEDVMDYYDAHLEDYAMLDTNELTTYIPLEDVESNIESNLIRKAAVIKAEADATEFAIDLTPSRYGEAETMEALAEKRGLTISISEPFSEWGKVPELDDVYINFNKAAFALDPNDSDTYFSDAVTGKDNVYIIATHTNIPSHIPEFDEVKEKALDLAQQKSDADKFAEQIEEIRTDILDSVKDGSSFADAAKRLNLAVTNLAPFAVYSASMGEMDNFNIIVPGILNLNSGQLSDMLLTIDGALLAYVISREPSDFSTTEAIKPDILRTLHGSRMRILFDDWADKLAASAQNAVKIEDELEEDLIE